MKPNRPLHRSKLAAWALALPLTAAISTPTLAFDNCQAGPSDKLLRLFQPRYHNNFASVVAHRGLWGKAESSGNTMPENSFGAIEAAQDKCLDAVELDVKMTSDGVPVLMHDFNLGRTTNVYKAVGGARKYNPDDNSGYNPKVDQLESKVVTELYLLSPNRNYETGYKVRSIESLLYSFRDLQGAVPAILYDVKSTGAVRAVNSAARKVLQSPGQVMAMKVNASLYQSRSAFNRDSPYIKGIPVFVTNNLGSIDINEVFNNWTSGSDPAVEVNVKTYDGILQVELDRLKRSRLASGIFNAIPDYPGGNGRFYNADGSCCYTLAQKYHTDPYSGVKENRDRRGDFNYLTDQGFTFITSDDPIRLASHLRSKGRR